MIIRDECLCGSTRKEELFVKEERTIIKCLECSLVYTREREEDYDSLYTEGDRYHVERETQIPYRERFDHDREVAKTRLQTYRNSVRWLDIGAGNGGFAWEAWEQGYDVVAIEPNLGMIRFAQSKGLDGPKFYQSVDDLPENQRDLGFDVITYHDVLEHIPDPVAELNKVCSLLREGGKIIVDVPSTEDSRFRELGAEWHHMKPKEHLFFFNERSFVRMVYDQCPGLDVEFTDRPIKGKNVFYLSKRSSPRVNLNRFKWSVIHGKES